MLQIQLYVEGQEVELFKDESITLNQSIQEIKDISKIFIDFTRSFSVPASKVNNKIFKHFYNFNIQGFDARYKKEALLHLNYSPFKKGKIKLDSVTLRENKPHTYKVTFFGDTISLKDTLQEDKLNLLSELNERIKFDYTDVNIQTRLVNGLDVTINTEKIVDAFIFPLITHTERLIYDSSQTADVGTSRNIFYNASGTYGVPFGQLKPALKLLAIIRAIEVQYPTIRFSEDFFSSTNSVFGELYMWLHINEGAIDTDIQRESQVTDINLISEENNETADLFVEGQGKNKIVSIADPDNPRKLFVNVKNKTSESIKYRLIIKKDGELFRRANNISGETNNGEELGTDLNGDDLPNGEYTFFIFCESASEFEVTITIEQESLEQFTPTRKIVFKGNASVLSNGKINVTNHLPDMKIIDFLTGLFKLYNLTAFQNKSGVIEVKTLDSFYDGSTTTHDITKFLDKKSKEVQTTIPFREINFKYESTETFFANQHKELSAIEWGALSFRADAIQRSEGTSFSVEVPFEHMKFERLFDANGATITDFQWGWSVDESQSPHLGKPILFYAQNASGSISAVNLAGTKVQITNPYMPFNAVTNSPCVDGSGGTQTLNFGAEMNEFCLVPFTKSIFETFYKTYIKDLFDPKKRLTKVKAYLPISVLQTLSLADQIIIFDTAFRINKISTNFSNNLSSLELTNIVKTRDFRTLLKAQGDLFTVDSNLLSVDSLEPRVDVAFEVDGFTIPDVTSIVPEDTKNYPVSDTDTPLTVTKAETSFTASSVTSSSIKFDFNVDTLGKIKDKPFMAGYGFLYADTSSKLDSTDLATLRATSGVTDEFFRTPLGQMTTGTKSVSISGLSSGNTRFVKFYVQTNIKQENATADIVSSIQSATTS